jgi:hypothetical protein
MRRLGNVAFIREMGNAYIILVRKSERNIFLCVGE